jgi:predicted ATPase
VYLKKLALENVRGFPDLEFDFERPNHEFAGWTVFVGGNASGKSTVLKAIALALMGPDIGRQLIVPAGWIGPNGAKADAKVEISWDKRYDSFKTGGAPPGRTFDAGVRWAQESPKHSDSHASSSIEFRGQEFRNQKRTRILSAIRGPWDPKAAGWFSAGYGPMRRLSGSSSESIRFSVLGGALSRFVTLFREDAALSESEVWLKLNYSRFLESRNPELEQLLEGVQDLLGDGLLPHGMKISKITVDNVFVQDGRGIELPMRDISDGCRSIYATVLDLVHAMADVYGVPNLFAQINGHTIVACPGVVLIDEIEAHLHPKWQREIPEWLKTHFPNVQFLVSTHSVLIAQAADPNGVFVLPSHDDTGRQPRMLDQHEYDLLRLRRAEKTLLGSAFGLKSTRSKWANDQIARWQRLNAKSQSGASLDQTERAEFADLSQQMKIVFEPSASEAGEPVL